MFENHFTNCVTLWESLHCLSHQAQLHQLMIVSFRVPECFSIDPLQFCDFKEAKVLPVPLLPLKAGFTEAALVQL